MRLAEALARGTTLACDGAMGTMLHAAGNSLDQALPALNLSDPGLVRAIHDSYIGVGVDIIQTNTFGASRLRLTEHGYGDRVTEINRAGVRIARRAIGDRGILLAGSVSPAVTVQQRRRVDPATRAAALREQIEALRDVDVILLETFGYLEEFIEAIEVATGTAKVPVMAQATFGPDLRMLSGHTVREMAAAAGSPIAVLGLNCTLGPQRSLAVLRELRHATDLPLSVQPNAGLPRRIAPARFEYDVDSEYFARYIRQLLEAGASIVGGCCGTTPAQIAAAVEVVRDRRQRPAPRVDVREEPLRPARAPAAVRPAAVSPGRGQMIIAELTTPLGGNADETVALASELAGAGAGFVSIAPARTYRTGAARAGVLDIAAHVHLAAGVETIATVTTWDRTIMALQADLLGAHALGLRRIICETGTPPLLGDYPHVDGVWDVDSIGLIGLLASLNRGTDNYGLELGTKTDFEIGARINPGSRTLDREAERAGAKIAAGATFLVTRPVYELTGLERLLEAAAGVPVLATVQPLTNFEDAEWLAHEVPDVTIPPATLAALERAGGEAPRVGAELATELAVTLRGMTSGLVIAPTTDAVETTRRIVAAVS
jgi:homocysteine S-methyltransferase